MSPETSEALRGHGAATAEPAAPTTQPASEPATSSSGNGASLGTLADAFRDPDAREALKERDRGQADADAEASSGESAAPERAASKPGERGPSRRGAAQAIKERDAELERLVGEREAEKQQASRAAADLAQLHERQTTARSKALELIGDDQEFTRLQAARLRNRPLSAAEDDALDRMLVWREHAQTFWELADRGHKVEMAKRLGDRISKHGLDKQTAFGADLPDLVDHAVSVTEARVRAESAEKIAELERQVKGLSPKAAAAGRLSPTTGGGSGSGSAPSDGASPLEWFSSGIRSGAHRRPAPAMARRR